MESVLEEGQQQQQHHYVQQLESSSPYSLFVLAIISLQTKEKYLRRFRFSYDKSESEISARLGIGLVSISSAVNLFNGFPI